MTDDITLTVHRVIAAPPARLFEAWTTPALLRSWWGPKDVRCIEADVDLRVGGAYRLGNQLPDGRVLWITGAFELIEPPRKLVYSWQIGDEPRSRVTVRFDALDPERTDVTVLHERIASVATRDEHGRGWDGCLDGLAAWATLTDEERRYVAGYVAHPEHEQDVAAVAAASAWDEWHNDG